MTSPAILRSITLTAAIALIATKALGQATVDISGRVVDESTRPIAGARLELKPGSRRVVSDEEGKFVFRNVTPDAYTIGAQRIGYRPFATQVQVSTSGAQPTIVLVAIPQVLDSVRVRERASNMRLSALVLDDAGIPIPDVAVVIAGIENTLRTDSSGRFVVSKRVHGGLIVRMRKIGYGAYFGSLTMFAEREDTLRMSRLAQGLSAVEITAASGFGRDTFVYKDLDQRMRWRTHQSSVMTREDLDRMGRVNLDEVVGRVPSCIVLNGAGKTSMPTEAYYADQVEAIEIFPPKSDWSGNLASRGCGGGRIRTLVIWLRKDTTVKR